ncbi:MULTISPECIES: hypothetical protein [unclassified Thalassospira]|uniref:hypothetical protein n=1 Tax=unclassified Thalassospira TaxID=2648997 RepID=UPI000EE517AB|nr:MULTISPECIES: hypothetical protein [unclassified Thalassospira]HAI31866.1 hypothetical protein [Thalassospira sp.]|tara:strand:+ start:7799 stop:7990 length:192 start_codon:yes stop_codon:yes gene_type:complete
MKNILLHGYTQHHAKQKAKLLQGVTRTGKIHATSRPLALFQMFADLISLAFSRKSLLWGFYLS